MTVTTTTSRVSYTGDGQTREFAVPFPFLDQQDIRVTLVGEGQGEKSQTLGMDYTVSGAGAVSGGAVSMTTSPIAGQSLVIWREVTLTQGTSLRESGPLPAATLERMADRSMMAAQQLAEQMVRTIRAPVGDAGINLELPSVTARASRFLAFDGEGNVTTETLSVGTTAVTSFAAALLDDADAAAARATLGLVDGSAEVNVSTLVVDNTSAVTPTQIAGMDGNGQFGALTVTGATIDNGTLAIEGPADVKSLAIQNAFEIAAQNGLADSGMGSAWYRDVFTDETGINTSASTAAYDSADDAYGGPNVSALSGGTVSSDGEFTGFPDDNAFDGNTSDSNYWASERVVGLPHYIRYDLGVGNAEVFKQVDFTVYSDGVSPSYSGAGLRAGNIKGSHDGSTWTTLGTFDQTNAAFPRGDVFSVDISSNTVAYRHIEFAFTTTHRATAISSVILHEIEALAPGGSFVLTSADGLITTGSNVSDLAGYILWEPQDVNTTVAGNLTVTLCGDISGGNTSNGTEATLEDLGETLDGKRLIRATADVSGANETGTNPGWIIETSNETQTIHGVILGGLD